MCRLHINTLCQCNFELMEGELSWEQGDTVLFLIKDGLVMEPYPEKWHGIFRQTNKDGVSRGFANEIQGLELP